MKAKRIAKAILKWAAIVVFGGVILLLLFAEGFDRYLATERGARWLYRNVPVENIDIRRTESGLRYLRLGDTSLTPLLLIHGAPGSLLDWQSLAKQDTLYQKYYLLIVERPGYGAARPRGPEPSIKVQAQRIAGVLEEENVAEAIVLGHSYGAPIAVVMGAFAPERIAHIYGISGQYDPDNEIVFGISHWINFKLFKYLLPRLLWVSNVEKLTHAEAQREVMDLYPAVSVPVTLVHGDADSLVPYKNSPFLMQKLNGTEAKLITLAGEDHPIHMQIPEEIARMLMGEIISSQTAQ